ncbi:hypothetical protein ABH309_13705 [Chromobacterium piscinae]|uniref:DUF2531 family protein n=1 Tax=Chromobacterium piscinae TaxID=686831 RepID=A0ABV0H7B6_9NEIS
MILKRYGLFLVLYWLFPAWTMAAELPQTWAVLSREHGCLPAAQFQADLGRPMTLSELSQRTHGRPIASANDTLPFPLWRIALQQPPGELWVLSEADCQTWLKLLAHAPNKL